MKNSAITFWGYEKNQRCVMGPLNLVIKIAFPKVKQQASNVKNFFTTSGFIPDF